MAKHMKGLKLQSVHLLLAEIFSFTSSQIPSFRYSSVYKTIDPLWKCDICGNSTFCSTPASTSFNDVLGDLDFKLTGLILKVCWPFTDETDPILIYNFRFFSSDPKIHSTKLT